MLASASDVYIATDHSLIRDSAEGFGANVVMTSSDHKSGSDRITECADILSWPDDQMIVNLQGDEPLMPPACLEQVASLLASDGEAVAASLYWPATLEEIEDPNAVKVVLDQDDRALMFSRSAIPNPRDYSSFSEAMDAGLKWLRHLGLYAYRAGSLRRFSSMKPTPIEQTEHLEQLRYLETGGKIALAQACEMIPAGVDTIEDLERVRNYTSL
jgi:3-deoxy-manno-octulosonate cytidylyltransferase (CMP-KDO synthetase)